MPEELQQNIIVDLDVYGRNSKSGGALVHTQDIAISNAIILFLTANRGDYLYRPDLSGVLDEMLFKGLTQERINLYQSRIVEELEVNFGDIIEDVQVKVTPNLKDRYFEIDLFYVSSLTQETNQAVFFTSSDDIELTRIITDINFIDDNLYGFVQVKLFDVNQPLLKNANDGYWYWGNFRFVNFSEESDNFQTIFDLINR